MGLAASQAKLLTITSRLSDNELRSQSITAAKMALASQSTDASRKYINSLNATEFNYKTYDADGEKVQVPLTGFQMTTYGPLKNQYGLINSSGQILLSEVDAKNYDNSANMDEFLAKYGVEKIDTGEVRTLPNVNFEEELAAWEASEPQEVDFYGDEEVQADELSNKFFEVAHSTFDFARVNLPTEAGLKAARNLLALMIDYGTGTYPKNVSTSDGHLLQISSDDCNYLIAPGAFYSGEPQSIILSFYPNGGDYMTEISDALKNGYDAGTFYATSSNNNDGYSAFQTSDTALLCNYTSDSDGNVVRKTLYQKCIDLLYLINQNYSSASNPGNVLQSRSFDTHLSQIMSEIRSCVRSNVFFEDAYNNAIDEWTLAYPESTYEEPIYKYSDNDKAQWYINLWHRINGPADEKDGTETVTDTARGAFSEYGSDSTSIITTSTRNRYEILEDGLMNSQQWLKYALETGAVSIERVNFTDETIPQTGLKNAEWKSIIYTNALDITEQNDERTMAVAEAEYEQAQREIENKDKQYDSMLKLLDTEHNTLQTEYESVKKVITKNMERTLNIYKA